VAAQEVFERVSRRQKGADERERLDDLELRRSNQ
jgi:hypothetical protein